MGSYGQWAATHRRSAQMQSWAFTCLDMRAFRAPETFFSPGKKTGGWAADWVPGNTSPCRHMLVWSFNEAKMSTFELDFPDPLALRSLKGSEVGVIIGSCCLAWSRWGQEGSSRIRNAECRLPVDLFLWLPHVLDMSASSVPEHSVELSSCHC